MIIQIIGLPGSGKTELAKALKERINAIHLNADEVRATVNSDLRFTPEDRIEQARRMGEMARLIANQGVAPVIVDLIISLFELHDWSAPTTLMLGRYQPWHEGHHALYLQAGMRTNQVLLGVRNTYNTSEKDPLTFDEVKDYIAKDEFMKDAMVLRLPNITDIVYGRDVGYKIEQVDLGADIHAISATEKRRELGI